jgi:hypothetical protein
MCVVTSWYYEATSELFLLVAASTGITFAADLARAEEPITSGHIERTIQS